ncbi:MAG: GxxExxY protein [Planctomycetota bacterium]
MTASWWNSRPSTPSSPIHTAQVIGYLKALDCPSGLLLNFKTDQLKHGIRKVLHPKHHTR